ncbi:MAG: NAD(P)H-dependent oxidoreductase, partial [Candidatus Thorarchaeota archaeon]
MARQAVLLIGSPRWLRSTSYSLGAYLIEKLEHFDCETIHIHKASADSMMTQDMVRSVNAADLIILSAPL